MVAVVLANTAKYEGRLSKVFWKMAHDKQREVLHLSYSASETDLEPAELLKVFIGYWESSIKPATLCAAINEGSRLLVSVRF